MLQLAFDPHQWMLLLALLQGVAALLNPPQTADPFPAQVPALHLTYTYKDGALDVPPPALVPEGFWATPLGKDWANVGDVRRAMSFVDADGTRYEVDALGFFLDADDADGKRRPLFEKVRRYRADGTLEVQTMFFDHTSGRPTDWIAYAADGETPVLRVLARGDRQDGVTYAINAAVLYDDAGRDVAMYEVNPDATIYIKKAVEWDGKAWQTKSLLEGTYSDLRRDSK